MSKSPSIFVHMSSIHWFLGFLLSKFHPASCKGPFGPVKGTPHYLQTLADSSINTTAFITVRRIISHCSHIRKRYQIINTVCIFLSEISNQTTKKTTKNSRTHEEHYEHDEPNFSSELNQTQNIQIQNRICITTE